MVKNWYIYLLILMGCADQNRNNDQVFIYNQPNPITSLDPVFAKSQNNIWATNHLYSRLVELDESLMIKPSLAKAWSFSENNTKLTFNLREDVYFHENVCFGPSKTRKLIASDVVYSLNRLIDPKVSSPGSWLFNDKKGKGDLFNAPNDSTLVIQLKDPFIPILGILTMQYCSVVPYEAVMYYGDDFRSNPVGSGPFVFKRWIESQALFLKKNEEYFDLDTTTVDYIKTTFIPDKQIAMYELLNGNIDFISGIESSYVNDLLDENGGLLTDLESKIRFVKTPYLNTEYLGINQLRAKGNILEKKELRQALNYAVDKETMLKTLRNGVGRPANQGFIPAGLPAYSQDINGYKYDVVKARRLLQQCGYDNETITITTNNEYLDICTYVSKQWEKIGIRSEIEVQESAILRDGMRKQKVDMFRASWIADYPDEESFLCVFYGNNPAPPNYTRFSNGEFDSLYVDCLKEQDVDKRLEQLRKMDSIIIEEAPVIFLFYDESAVFLSQTIEGYQNNGLNLLNVDFSMKEK